MMLCLTIEDYKNQTSSYCFTLNLGAYKNESPMLIIVFINVFSTFETNCSKNSYGLKLILHDFQK